MAEEQLVSSSERAKQITEISNKLLDQPSIIGASQLKALVDRANREFTEELEYFKAESIKTETELRNASILANNLVRNSYVLEAAPDISRSAYRIIVKGIQGPVAAVIVVGSGKYRFAEPDKFSSTGFGKFSLYRGRGIGLTNILFDLYRTSNPVELPEILD